MRFALLPAKTLRFSKTRLSPALADEHRERIGFAMFEDVLDSLLRAQAIDAVAVVSADPRLLDLAAARNAHVIDEGEPRGLNGAAGLGTARCQDLGASSVAIVLSDLPLVRPSDVDALHVGLPEHPCVRLVRSHEGLGTNAILRRPPRVIPTRFGGSSFEGHVAVATAASIPYEELFLPRLAFDVDTIDDLRRVLTSEGAERTRREAERIGVR